MDVLLERPPRFVIGPLLGLLIIAVFATLKERHGVVGGYSELIERASGARRALGWKFVVGITPGGLLFSLAGGS